MQTFSDFYDNGILLYQKAQYKEAIELFDKTLSLRPQHAGALYSKGECLFYLGSYIEAANSFWASYIHLKFKKEALLMTARSLTMAELSWYACSIFEMLSSEQIDTESLIFYITSLRLEGRILDAAKLLPRLDRNNSYNAVLLRGYISHELGKYEEAKVFMESIINQDQTGHVYDRLIGIYLSLGQYKQLIVHLKNASEKFNTRDFYKAMLASIELLVMNKEINLESFQTNERFDMLDAALYLKKNADNNLLLTGSTCQTFDVLKPLVMSNGIICEFGVRNGHSINHIGSIFSNKKVYGFDSFEGLPESWHNEDAGSYTTGGKMPSVPSNVSLIQGWFDASLPIFIQTLNEPIALLNIDCDLYSSTKTVFDFLGKYIIEGTVIVFDEYIGNKQWREDEFKAFQEWVTNNNIKYKYITASPFTKQVSVQILSK